jgi:hypothetical protein
MGRVDTTCYPFGMPLSDTSPAIRKMQLEIQRAMTGEERLLRALEMSVFARELAKAKIRSDHPDWSEAQVTREVLRLSFLPAPLPRGLR